MENSQQTALLRATRKLLRPLIRMLLRNGITCNEFCELARQSYVETALSDFREPGRKATDSRASVITGLNRKEVRRLRSLMDAAGPASVSAPPARGERVVSGWMRDSDFLSDSGEPRLLAFDGSEGFSELVRRYSGDLPPRAVLNELKRVQVVSESESGIRLLKAGYVPQGDPEHLLGILGTDVADFIQTVDHNLACQRTGETPRLQRTLRYDRIPRSILPAWQALVEEESQALLQRLNTWLSRHDGDVQGDADRITDPVTTGLGLFYLESNEEAGLLSGTERTHSPDTGDHDESN